MGIVSVGSLVLCMIIKPQVGQNAADAKEISIQKTPGIVRQVFTKKVIRDIKNTRVAVHEDKDMLIIETLDGEAEITIGADACKRIVLPKELKEIDAAREAIEKGQAVNIRDLKDQKIPEESQIIPEEKKPESKVQTDKEKAELLKMLDK